MKILKEDGKFKKLTKEYFDSYIKRFPEYGSFLGLRQYDGKWSDESKGAYSANTIFFRDYLKKFKKITLKGLSEKENLDRKIIIREIEASIFYLQKLRIWESDPDIAEGIGSLLFVLLAREEGQQERLAKSMNNALRGIPAVFEQVKTRISKPYKLWTEMALESCEGLKLFLENLKSQKQNNPKIEFSKNVKNAIEAVSAYADFLKEKILPKAQDRYIIGKENFKKLIKFRDLELNISDMLKIGEKALEADKAELKEIADQIQSGLTAKQAEERIDRKHLKDFKEIIKQYQRIVKKARDFIKIHNLMFLPDDEKVLVKETPAFLAGTTPFAAYFPPPKFGKKQIGIYIVTPSLKKGTLEKHNYTQIFNTSVHEAYPGHHLQLSLGLKNPSLARALSNATETVEGWAFYCEEYMRDVGFNNTNETRFIQTLDEIWRAARVIIDIKLHQGEMNFGEAVDFLMEQTGMEKENAIAEIKRYTKSPSYQLSYLIGKHLIKKLKREIQERMGEGYSDRFFHDTILKAGSIPVKYLKQEFDLKIKAKP